MQDIPDKIEYWDAFVVWGEQLCMVLQHAIYGSGWCKDQPLVMGRLFLKQEGSC